MMVDISVLMSLLLLRVCLTSIIMHILQITGLVHTTGGYSLYAMHTTANSFGLSQQTGPSSPNDPHNDVYACVADAGWITGHTYIVYGPLLNGISTFMFESTPMYPDHGRYWDMVQRHKITVFYTAPVS